MLEEDRRELEFWVRDVDVLNLFYMEPGQWARIEFEGVPKDAVLREVVHDPSRRVFLVRLSHPNYPRWESGMYCTPGGPLRVRRERTSLDAPGEFSKHHISLRQTVRIKAASGDVVAEGVGKVVGLDLCESGDVRVTILNGRTFSSFMVGEITSVSLLDPGIRS